MTKIAIVGSRKFNDFELLQKVVDGIINDLNLDDVKIVSGGAKGTDSLAEQYAILKNFETIIFKPDWKRYGRGAGIVRNKQIVKNSDIVIAFWDAESKGAKSSIDFALKNNKKCFVYNFITSTLEEKVL